MLIDIVTTAAAAGGQGSRLNNNFTGSFIKSFVRQLVSVAVVLDKLNTQVFMPRRRPAPASIVLWQHVAGSCRTMTSKSHKGLRRVGGGELGNCHHASSGAVEHRSWHASLTA